jgi:hypothetical protein
VNLFRGFKISVLCLVFLEVSISRAQENNFEWIRPGTGLTYQVNTEGSDYQYIVSIKGLYPMLSFRWDMTFPSRNWGNVEISQEAMDEATEQRNYFMGADLYLEDQTSV